MKRRVGDMSNVLPVVSAIVTKTRDDFGNKVKPFSTWIAYVVPSDAFKVVI